MGCVHRRGEEKEVGLGNSQGGVNTKEGTDGGGKKGDIIKGAWMRKRGGRMNYEMQVLRKT